MHLEFTALVLLYFPSIPAFDLIHLITHFELCDTFCIQIWDTRRAPSFHENYEKTIITTLIFQRLKHQLMRQQA